MHTAQASGTNVIKLVQKQPLITHTQNVANLSLGYCTLILQWQKYTKSTPENDTEETKTFVSDEI